MADKLTMEELGAILRSAPLSDTDIRHIVAAQGSYNDVPVINDAEEYAAYGRAVAALEKNFTSVDDRFRSDKGILAAALTARMIEWEETNK